MSDGNDKGEAVVHWRCLVANAPVGIFQTDAEGMCEYVNAAWCAISGLDIDQALGAGWTHAIHPEDRQAVVAEWQRTAARGFDFELEYRFLRADGVSIWVVGRAAPIHDDAGAITGFAGSVTDVTTRRHAEEALLERENRFRDVADQAPVMIGATDAAGHITFLNKTWLEFRGKTLEEEEGWAWAAGLHPEDRGRTISEMEARITLGQPYSVEYRIQDRHGTYHWMLDTAIPRIDRYGELMGYIGTAIIIDAQKRLQAQLETELAAKENLLREVHHRVKNNLQVVSSLISLQARKAVSEVDRAAFDDLRHRLLAMAVVHDRLYQRGEFGEIDFQDYIVSLIGSLRDSIAHGERLQFELAVASGLDLPLDKALPAGMIVTELVTNVGKHAFADGTEGRCVISAWACGDRAVVVVRDDGVGFPAEFSVATPSCFGWQLIRSLVTQLDGEILAENAGGARVELQFALA